MDIAIDFPVDAAALSSAVEIVAPSKILSSVAEAVVPVPRFIILLLERIYIFWSAELTAISPSAKSPVVGTDDEDDDLFDDPELNPFDDLDDESDYDDDDDDGSYF